MCGPGADSENTYKKVTRKVTRNATGIRSLFPPNIVPPLAITHFFPPLRRPCLTITIPVLFLSPPKLGYYDPDVH